MRSATATTIPEGRRPSPTLSGLGAVPIVPAIASFAEGMVIGERFAIRGSLGVGGMAEVYEADDLLLLRKVAIKVALRTELAAGLLAEARALAAIRHPGTVGIHDVGTHDGVPFLVLERLYGVTLDRESHDRRLHGRPFSVPEVVGLLVSIARALDAAHGAGVSHRDLKPSNVLLVSPQRLVLLDFGLVQPHCEDTMQLGGSPEYMAPEVVLGRVHHGGGARVDLYSLGALAFELLVGEPPFVGDDFAKVLIGQIEASPARIRDLRPEVPAALDELIAALLAKDPEDRPQDAQQVLWDLARIEDARSRPS